MTTIALQLGIVLIHCFFIGFTYRISYNKILNPIVIFGPFLIVQWIVQRIGVIDGYFYPSALQDVSHNNIILNYFINGKYINIFGIIPEILLIGDILLGLSIDAIFWLFLDKRRRLLIN